MKTPKNQIFLILAISVAISCKHVKILPGNGAKDTKDTIALTIDLDSCKNTPVSFENQILTHKIFDKIDETDTLQVTSNLISIKTSEYILKTHESETCYSRLEIIYQHRRVFLIDSILTTGMYYYEPQRNLLAIPVIKSQNSDDFFTLTTLYLCDLRNNLTRKINGSLVNSAFALICSNSNNLIYNNSDKILSYDLNNDKENMIINFDNPLISIFKLSIVNNNLEVFYLKDLANDIIHSASLKMALVRLPNSICGRIEHSSGKVN